MRSLNGNSQWLWPSFVLWVPVCSGEHLPEKGTPFRVWGAEQPSHSDCRLLWLRGRVAGHRTCHGGTTGPSAGPMVSRLKSEQAGLDLGHCPRPV